MEVVNVVGMIDTEVEDWRVTGGHEYHGRHDIALAIITVITRVESECVLSRSSGVPGGGHEVSCGVCLAFASHWFCATAIGFSEVSTLSK